jgi:prevent-host-death family protein
MGSWAVAKAKAKFSELIDSAQESGAQEITRNGKLVGVLIPPSEWNQAARMPLHNARTTAEFFKSSPLAGSGLKLKRSRSKVRRVSL